MTTKEKQRLELEALVAEYQQAGGEIEVIEVPEYDYSNFKPAVSDLQEF